MSASLRLTEEYVVVSPRYANEQYLRDVSIRQSNNSHDHVTLNETQLIERAKLTSSAKEAKRADGPVYPKNAGLDVFVKRNVERDKEVKARSEHENTDEYVSAVDPDTDDAGMFYETQTDETTLIKYAKLADDGLDEVAKCDGKLIHDIIIAAEKETKLRQVKSDENADGFQTPVNSEAGDAAPENVKEQLAMCFDVAVTLSKGPENPKQLRLYAPITAENAVLRTDNRPKQVTVHKAVRSEVLSFEEEGPKDPDFQRLVVDVVTHLQDCDLDEILSMFTGSGILEMTGLVPPADLMTILQRHRIISRDNLYHLQELVMRLDDSDLYIKAVQYTKHHHDIVYFYQDQDIPTKGFGKVQCYISGRDFTRLTREDLELVRFKVASLVFMPAHYVYIVGIEPGQRVVITLMLLEIYVQELSEMAKEGLPELSLANVDAIQICGKVYNTTGTTEIEKYQEGGHATFLSVYQQLRDKSKRLEERNSEVYKLREEAQFMQLELETMGAELELLTEKALFESVARQHVRSRPINKHPRTRSFPLTFREEPDDRKFALALESAVVSNASPPPVQSGKFIAANKVGKKEKEIHKHRIKDEESRVVAMRSHGMKPEMFQQTNDLMGEIEDILTELAGFN